MKKIKIISAVNLKNRTLNQTALIQIKGGNDPDGLHGGILNIK